MYRLRGNNSSDNHYMSETSSNASSCSSVCGWSYGGTGNLSSNSEHNTILENKLTHGNSHEKGNGNSRGSNNHHSHDRANSNMINKFGLDPIPEYDIPDDPPIFQPL